MSHCDEQSQRTSDEFAKGADDWLARADGPSRRQVLKTMAASLALAGVGVGCSDRPTDERLVAQTRGPEQAWPGETVGYATTLTLAGYGRGVIATVRDGRPIKLDGNPDHPSSLGGSDAFLQAAILDLYDPSRSKTPTFAGQPATWEQFFAAIGPRLERYRKGGTGLRVLSETVTSPTLIGQIAEFEDRFPGAVWHTFDPLPRPDLHWPDPSVATEFADELGWKITYDFSKAKTIVAIDSDFLTDPIGGIRYSRDFIDGRRVRDGNREMNRLYVVESGLTLTGSMADHRKAMRPSEMEAFVDRLADAVAGGSSNDPFVRAIAMDLSATRGRSVIVAGPELSKRALSRVRELNLFLGNLNETVRLYVPLDFVRQGHLPFPTLATLVADMSRSVETVLILGGDPAFTAFGDSGFREALESLSKRRDGFTAHLGERANATAFACQWHLPEAHELESWGDARGHEGTASLIQPLITPLFGGRSKIEVLEALLGRPSRRGYEIVRDYWRSPLGDDFESRWQEALARGVVQSPSDLLFAMGTDVISSAPTARPPATNDIELVFRPDQSVFDGRFAANAWLQELPRPFTKLVWDNAAWMSPATARSLGVAEGDVVKIEANGRAIEIPVGLLHGAADGVVTLHVGYGQSLGGGEAVGVNVYPLRSSDSPYLASGRITKTDRHVDLVFTRSHHAMDTFGKTFDMHAVSSSQSTEAEGKRNIVRIVDVGELAKGEEAVEKLGGEKKPLLSLYPVQNSRHEYAWGMSIDLTACIGCNACIVACQAENNIPVVGKKEVGRQREMHWLRIDSYRDEQRGGETRVTHQPVPCMHCENAPCEVVCPVAATVHSVEGLNQMVYNRCVGTRYCSNNCPYKVRRFNFFNYTRGLRGDFDRQLVQNPEVTVRTRGVMEKCTYCVQRLERTRIRVRRERVEASERARLAGPEAESPSIADSADAREFELLESLATACQQACPTRAIEFGSIEKVAGRETRVMKAKAEPTDYALLRELNTRPRTTYLARVQNPSPELEGRA